MYLAPMLVAGVTVYVAEKKQRRTWQYYAVAGAVSNALFVVGTLLIFIEGIICAIIAVPLFAFIGGVFGLLMGAVCRKTNWPKQTLYSIAILPLMLGAIPPQDFENQYVGTIERKIVIEAPPENIWGQLLHAPNIQPGEVNKAWIYRIGVPLPESGITQRTSTELVRHITMGKSVHFDQVATDWKENQYIRWHYRFAEDSFPPRALDDHVMIGGHYFDLIDTEYKLSPLTSHSTELAVRIQYRVTTQFNWYAKQIAQVLIGNFEEHILQFYQNRSIALTKSALIN